MKDFFKFTFASVFGFFIALSFIFIIFLFVVFGALSSLDGNKNNAVSPNSVLEIKLDHPVYERTSQNLFENLSMGEMAPLGLNDIRASIKTAKSDKRIKGILLNLSVVQTGYATLEEIRSALEDFKKSGKFVLAYGEMYSQQAYYLAAIADKIFLNPQGIMDLTGLRAQVTFYKGALDKLELEPVIIRHGKFKSAVEPYLLDQMSDSNRKQVTVYLNSIWDHVLGNIAKNRELEPSFVKKVVDSLLIRNAPNAVQYKMADRLLYKDELLALLRKDYLGLKEEEKINFINIKKYHRSMEGEEGSSKDRIAVIYAAGEISSGKGDDYTIGSETLSEAIRKAARDKKIKAIVLRVNSPGGSSLASDVIWREVVLAKKIKPVIVSMGNVAASGGYYIACPADVIVAHPNTITGSIGVFGLFVNAQKLMNNKLGITFDVVKTNPYADIGNPFRPITEAERSIFQQGVEEVYDTFLTRVSEGRKMDKAAVDKIGEGRVWSGADAKRLGLIDELGGTGEAIAIAAKKAKLDTYRIVELPDQEDPLEKLLEDLSLSALIETHVIASLYSENNQGEALQYIRQLQSLLKNNGILMRMPETIDIR